jgi:receptor expression-enhancing protein 5/6
MEIIDALCDRLNLGDLGNIKIIKDISERINVKPQYIGLAFISFVCLFLVFEYGTYWITFAIGFLYPAYMTYKCIETDVQSVETQEEKLWLSYWIVFSLMNVFDKFLSAVLVIIPFYNIIKIGYIIWLFHPKTRGAKIVYDKIIRRFLKPYEEKIDKKMEELKEKMDEIAPVLKEGAKAIKKDVTEEIVNRTVTN